MQWLTNLTWFAFGWKHFTKQGYERAAARFDNSIFERDHKGQVVMITGANSGIGYAASTALARLGCTVFMVCRNKERGEAAVDAVRRSTGNPDVHLGHCDVSHLGSIKRFSEDFLTSDRPLHALVNNAGVLLSARGRSVEGHDLSFATNTLGGLVLARRLLPALQRAPGSRVVFVSSGGMYTEPLMLSGWEDASRPWDGTKAYALDKRRQVAQAEELARRWGPLGVQVVSMHPGWADTEGVRTSLPGFSQKMASSLRTAEQGADTVVWLCLQDASALEPGALYLDRQPQVKHLRFAGTGYEASAAAKLVDDLLGLAGLGEAIPASATS